MKPRCGAATYVRCKGIIERCLLPSPIAVVPFQKLRPSHLEHYYATASVSAATLTLHQAVLHRALRKAVKDRLMQVNVATDLDGNPIEHSAASKGATLGMGTHVDRMPVQSIRLQFAMLSSDAPHRLQHFHLSQHLPEVPKIPKMDTGHSRSSRGNDVLKGVVNNNDAGSLLVE